MNIEKPKSSQPIPENAKKVFEGVIFNVWQWEQEMFDGKKEIFEKVERPDTANVLAFTEDGKIIVLNQQQPGKDIFSSLPGGRIDEGELPLEAAKRELLEETGYQTKDIQLWHSAMPINKVDWSLFFFVAKNCKKVCEQSLDCGGEKIEVNLVETDAFLEMLLVQKIKGSEIIMKLLSESLIVIDKKGTVEKIREYFA